MHSSDPVQERAASPAALPPRLKRFGGHVGLLRLLRSGDEPQLQEFFRSHTADTIYERYGCLISTMTAERASQLVNVDQSRDCALGIFEPTPEGEKLHAVGRYCLDRDGTSAEAAFVVRETMRHQGMATTLLQTLIHTARTRGLTKLWAQVNAQNTEMLAIFRHHGFAVSPQPDIGMMEVALDLGATPAPPSLPARIKPQKKKRR